MPPLRLQKVLVQVRQSPCQTAQPMEVGRTLGHRKGRNITRQALQKFRWIRTRLQHRLVRGCPIHSQLHMQIRFTSEELHHCLPNRKSACFPRPPLVPGLNVVRRWIRPLLGDQVSTRRKQGYAGHFRAQYADPYGRGSIKLFLYLVRSGSGLLYLYGQCGVPCP